MTLPAPLPLAKKDTPRSAPVAALLTTTIKTITKGAPTLKNKNALNSFWAALSLYASRNLAAVDGTGAPAAAPAKAAVAKTAQPKAKLKTKTADAAGETATA